jgi:2-amino-4-hydroxy-6-hydroxymethyldihydropteridine diphosphokinase
MHEPCVQAYIGIGANLGDPIAQVRRALDRLARDVPGTRLLARSRLYRNPPMGPQDQPDYVNAVAAIDTSLGPQPLLEELHRLEREQGRERSGPRWGARSLDLDLLLYGDQVIDAPGLRVPHPGLCERDFVLFPLFEVAADLHIPGRGPLAAFCAGRSPQGLAAVLEEGAA